MKPSKAKFLGIFSSKQKARDMQHTLEAKRFHLNPLATFHISEYELNKAHWEEGFAGRNAEIWCYNNEI